MYTHDIYVNILKFMAAEMESLKSGSLKKMSMPVNELKTSPNLFQVAIKHSRDFKFYSLKSQTGLWHQLSLRNTTMGWKTAYTSIVLGS